MCPGRSGGDGFGRVRSQTCTVHRIFVDQLLAGLVSGALVSVSGDEAQHALRVKRVGAGDEVELLDGRGGRARGYIRLEGGEGDRRGKGRRSDELVVVIDEVRIEPRPARAIHVYSAVPKGGRVDEMIDQLAQVGAMSWTPMECDRSVVQPRESKLQRLERIAQEASKQCGRAWELEIRPQVEFAEAIRGEAGRCVVIADATGSACKVEMFAGSKDVRVLVGPEGGWSEAEVAAGRAAGAESVRFGPHIMRIETAAVAAAAVMQHVGG